MSSKLKLIKFVASRHPPLSGEVKGRDDRIIAIWSFLFGKIIHKV